ncbi:hypothetical protein DN068_19900 [Taibaiella soli]|uniref:Porin n=1 Tax=Taibaiella soli TaxID=1649169 RepID=A0A2W2A7C5_9BACT|nr:hypothetical protein DN068_19900 [Taibaiella soli]
MLLFLSALTTGITAVTAQDEERAKALEVYGFVMTDIGYDFKSINPNWYDAMRVTKLPTYDGQYGPDGKVFFSVRQTRFGVKGWIPTPKGDVKTVFEFDMFGVGVDEGQTTMRLRHAYAEYGRFLVGQTNSPFMDGDVWPNTVEYWGPTGMVFFRNIQIRYAPVKDANNQVFVALERPGASADQGTLDTRTELDSVKGHFQLPDLSAHYQRSGKWGHVQLAGMLRQIKWQDIHTGGGYDISDSKIGWGVHLSTVINLGKHDVFRGSLVYGEGIENYMNDAPTDLGVEDNPGNPNKPITGKPLPITGTLAYLDHTWNKHFATAIGYSSSYVQNTDFASPSAYKMGQYASVNLVATPFSNAMIAAELQWGERTSFNGYKGDDVKLQFSFKYNFSAALYRHN